MSSRRHERRAAGASRAARPEPRTHGSPGEARADLLRPAADVIVIALAASLLVRLAAQAAHARFLSDECFHAYMSDWIARHARLPREIPAFYSGLYYYYPPLMHVIGALAVKAFGVASLRFLNLALLAVLFATLLIGPPKDVAGAARRWAVLLLAANAHTAAYAVRLYVEQLTVVLTIASLVLLMRLRARPRARTAIALGLALGLSLLAKQTSLVFVGVVGALTAWWAARGERTLARHAGLALAIGAALGVPYYARNLLLYGAPLYPMFARDLDPALWALHLKTYGLPVGEFYLTMARSTWPWLAMVFLAGLVWSVWSRAWNLVTVLLALCLVLLIAGPLMPIHDPRHMMPIVAMMALLGSLALHRALAALRWALAAVEVVLVVAAAVAVVRLPDFRRALDEPASFEEMFREVRAHTPEGATILSLWTYDTAYYAQRPATWLIPWGQRRHPDELFSERDPQRFRAALDRYGVDYVLLPLGQLEEKFNGDYYTQSLGDCVRELVGRGQMRVAWQTGAMALVGKTP